MCCLLLHPLAAAVVSSLKSPFFVGGEHLNFYRRKLDPGQQYCMLNFTFSEIVGEYCPTSVIFFSGLINFGFLPLACLYQLVIYFFADIAPTQPWPSSIEDATYTEGCKVAQKMGGEGS